MKDLKIESYDADGSLIPGQRTALDVADGGTGSNLGGTGPGVVIQATTGSALTVETALDETRGGTAQSTVTTGDLLFGGAANTWSKLAIGAAGRVLQVVAGIPAWVATTTLGLATTALDNLASVAINTSLISDTDITDDLGSTTIKWRNVLAALLTLEERTAPSTPASGDGVVWADADGNIRATDDAGRVSVLSTYQAVATPSSAASVDFQNIPQTGHTLKIRGILRPATDDVYFYIRLNNRSGATDYGWSVNSGDGGSDSSDDRIRIITGTTAGNGVGNGVSEGIEFEITIPNYTAAIGSLRKMVKINGGWWLATAGTMTYYDTIGALLFTEAINRVTIIAESGNIADGIAELFID